MADRKCFILLASKCYCCCQGNDDSDNHLFAYGELATYLWNHASSIFGLGDLKGLDWKQKCIKWWNCIRGTSQFNIMANCVPIFICWEIWCYRNKRKYDDIALSPQSILHKCIIWLRDMNFIINPKKVSSFFDFLTLSQPFILKLPIKIKHSILVQWNHPTFGHKLNIDGAARGNPGNFWAVRIIRDCTGDLLTTFSEHLGVQKQFCRSLRSST